MLLVVCCRYSLIANVIFALGLVNKLDGKGVRARMLSFLAGTSLTLRYPRSEPMFVCHWAVVLKFNSKMRLRLHRRIIAQHARPTWDPEYVLRISAGISVTRSHRLPLLAILGARTCAVFQHNRYVVTFFLLLGLAVMGLSIVSE